LLSETQNNILSAKEEKKRNLIFVLQNLSSSKKHSDFHLKLLSRQQHEKNNSKGKIFFCSLLLRRQRSRGFFCLQHQQTSSEFAISSSPAVQIAFRIEIGLVSVRVEGEKTARCLNQGKALNAVDWKKHRRREFCPRASGARARMS
jgi:hypothetical protein